MNKPVLVSVFFTIWSIFNFVVLTYIDIYQRVEPIGIYIARFIDILTVSRRSQVKIFLGGSSYEE